MLIKLARNLTGGGKSPQPIDNAMEYSLPRLDEQGASKRRIGLYLARWLGWAACACVPLAHGTPCANNYTDNTTITGSAWCGCNNDVKFARRFSPTSDSGNLDLSNTTPSILQCASFPPDPICDTPSPYNTTGTHYYKNSSETDSYFSCDWTPSVGYSNPQNYTPTPPPAPTPAPFAPTALLFALFASIGTFFAYRLNRNKSQKGN